MWRPGAPLTCCWHDSMMARTSGTYRRFIRIVLKLSMQGKRSEARAALKNDASLG